MKSDEDMRKFSSLFQYFLLDKDEKKMFFSTLIFLLFFFVPVHSSSYSFVNLIPSILANGRSVINEQVDPNALFNNTLPTFHFDRIPNSNQSNCLEDLQVFYRDLSIRKLWAIKSKSIFEHQMLTV